MITDPALPGIRPTQDVDLVTAAAAWTDYHAMELRLRERGFAQDVRPDAPLCRWRVDTVSVDLMPANEEILGFANPWYPLAIATAWEAQLPSGNAIRVIQAPVFVATKLEAFRGRGGGDYLFSHDLGDILGVLDGRDGLDEECSHCDASLRDYLCRQFAHLLSDRRFADSLPAHLPPDAVSQDRVADLEARIRRIAGFAVS